MDAFAITEDARKRTARLRCRAHLRYEARMGRASLILPSTLLSIVCGCASAVTEQSSRGGDSGAPPYVDAAARAGEAGSTSFEIESAGAGGAPIGEGGNKRGGDANSDAGTATAAAGSSESPAVPARAESGTRLCEDPRECRGLDCRSSGQSTVHACLADCASDVDCTADERCFERPGLQRSCFQSCQESAVVCNYQFDCADYYRTGQYLCFPKAWVRNWPPTEP